MNKTNVVIFLLICFVCTLNYNMWKDKETKGHIEFTSSCSNYYPAYTNKGSNVYINAVSTNYNTTTTTTIPFVMPTITNILKSNVWVSIPSVTTTVASLDFSQTNYIYISTNKGPFVLIKDNYEISNIIDSNGVSWCHLNLKTDSLSYIEVREIANYFILLSGVSECKK